MKKIISFFIIVICAFAASAQIQRTKPVNSKFDSATIATQVATNDVIKSTTKQNRELFKELDLSRTQMKQLKEMRKEAKIKKQTIESALTELKAAHQLQDLAAVEAATTKVNETLQAMAADIQGAYQGGAAGGAQANAGGSSSKDAEVTDVDFEEVADEKK